MFSTLPTFIGRGIVKDDAVLVNNIIYILKILARQEGLMGRGSRSRPARLAEKLRQIRLTLGESQEGMVKQLDLPNDVPGRHYISGFELGTREPTLPTLVRYSELINCWLDVLVKDDLNLPPIPWPCKVKSEGIKIDTISSRKKR